MTEKELNEVFGLRVKEIRKILNLSQTELGEILSENQRTISYIEDGERSVACSFALKLEEKLHVNLLWFLKGEGEKFLINEPKL